MLRNDMIIYTPTGQTFNNRKEARLVLGSAFYNRLEKDRKDLVFINDSQFATNGKTVDTNTQKISENE